MPKSTLKKYFVEPGMFFFNQKLNNDLVSLKQVFKQDKSNVTSGLQKEDKKLSEVDTKKETETTADSFTR